MSDFDEIVENVVNAIFIDIMGLTPKAALVLFTMLWCTYKVPVEAFKEGELGNIWHEVIGDKDNSENSTVYNIEVNVTKTENTQDFTIKRTKVFWKNSSKSDSVGYFKTDTEVEILDIKDGWCLVKGKGFETIIETVQDRKKKNRKPGVTIKSSELTGWVQKPCLKKFK